MIPQSTSIVVDIPMFLTGTSTKATGKTPAVTLSKTGGAFGNPSAGATNGVEIGTTGIYTFTVSTTDSNTVGFLWVKMTASGCDDGDLLLFVWAPPVPLDAAGTRTAVGLASANIDAQFTAAGTALTAGGVRTAVGLASANLDTQFTNAGTALNAAGVRSALGMAIANLDTQLAAINSAVGALPAPLTAATTRTALGMASANLDTQLGALGTSISGLPVPLTAATTRTALGLAAANLDTQFSALTTAIGALPVPLTAASTRAALGLAAANIDAQLATILAASGGGGGGGASASAIVTALMDHVIDTKRFEDMFLWLYVVLHNKLLIQDNGVPNVRRLIGLLSDNLTTVDHVDFNITDGTRPNQGA